MERTTEPRRLLDVSGAALVKVLATVVMVWVWLRLWQFIMLLALAVVLAIAFAPVVAWLERRRLPRGVGAVLVALFVAGLTVGFFWMAGASLMDQAKTLGSRISDVERYVVHRTPQPILRLFQESDGGLPDASSLVPYVIRAGRLALSAVIVGVLALIVMVYLLVEGRQTYQWLIAFVPATHRARTDQTALEAQEAVKGYVLANIATSVFAAIFVFVALSVLHVPAALLLALLAGIFDFIPVLGFICSAAPAVLLALTVSGPTAFLVAMLYVAYHGVENYFIAPKVYGGRLRLSNLAVIVAFAAGAELGGVIGALLALPVAAMYPAIERIWLKDYLERDTVERHRRIERQSA